MNLDEHGYFYKGWESKSDWISVCLHYAECACPSKTGSSSLIFVPNLANRLKLLLNASNTTKQTLSDAQLQTEHKNTWMETLDDLMLAQKEREQVFP